MKIKRIVQYLSTEIPLWFISLLTDWLPDNPLTCAIRGILSKPFFKKCGKNFQYGKRVRFLTPHNIEIGNDVYIAEGCWLGGGGGLILDDEIMFGPYVIVVTGTHTFKNNSARFGSAVRFPVKIGKGSWLAAHVVVAPGVSIGSGNLVGANAVVTKNTPPNVFVAGIPAKVIAERKDNPGEVKSRHE